MQQVTLIRQTLQPHLGWHGARVSFLALFLIALFRVKTVNFSQLATAFIGKAKTESNYKRLQRFFKGFDLEYHTLAKLVVNLMGIPQPWVLSLVRTTWEFGGGCPQYSDVGRRPSRGNLSVAVVDAGQKGEF